MKKIYTLFALSLILAPAADARVRATYQRTTQRTAPPQRTPAPQSDAGFNFPGQVIQHNGQLPYSIRGVLGDSDHHFGAKTPNTAEGHRYFSLNSLGRSELSPQQVMAAVTKNLDAVFPIKARDLCGLGVEVGNRFDLHIEFRGGEYLSNPVEVKEKTPYYFTVATIPGHTFQGKLTHGIVKDSTGELWMFQDGRGIANQESRGLIEANYAAGVLMWKDMARNIKELMPEINPRDTDRPDRDDAEESSASVSKVVLVNSYVNTGIKVKCGDIVTIRASGTVRFGDFAGSGGPEGILFNTDYNYFPDLLHGCLIGRLSRPSNDGWGYIGSGYTGTAEQMGVLELDVNDRDPANNRGAFRVEITVRRAR